MSIHLNATSRAMRAFKIPAPVMAGRIGVNMPAIVSSALIKAFLSSYSSGGSLPEKLPSDISSR